MQPVQPKLSYSDLVSKWGVDPSKKIELPRQKTVCILDNTNDYNRFCCSGEIEKLKQVPVHLFTGDLIYKLIVAMKYTLHDIESWSQEDDKSEDMLAYFSRRSQGIHACINYLLSLK
jgi:hypothetical protein